MPTRQRCLFACIRSAPGLLLPIVFSAAGVCSLQPAAAAHAAVGTPIANHEMPQLQGGRASPLRPGQINVLVFFRPRQERSHRALRELAQCKPALADKTVQWTGIVSASANSEDAASLIAAAGFPVRVLVDEGDALYGSLGLSLHPLVVVTDKDGKLAAFEPYRSVDFCPFVAVRIRHALGQISDAELKAVVFPAKSSEGGDAQVARRYRHLAEALLRDARLDKALDMVQKSLDRDPDVASAHVLMGQILSQQGKCAQAIPAFERALALNPTFDAARAGIANCKSAK